MKATISVKGNEYVLDIGAKQMILGTSESINPKKIKEVVEILHKKRVNEVALRSHGGLSDQNIQTMLEMLYGQRKLGDLPIEITFKLRRARG